MKRFTAIALTLLFALGLAAPVFAEDEATETAPPVETEPPADADDAAEDEATEDAD